MSNNHERLEPETWNLGYGRTGQGEPAGQNSKAAAAPARSFFRSEFSNQGWNSA